MSDPGLRHQQKNPYQQSADDVLAAFPSDSGHRLSESEARERLDKYGANELKAKKPVPGWKKFLAQFQNVLVVLLLVATVISAGLWWYERAAALPYEAIAIFAVVLLNALMGYIQESKAEEAVPSVALHAAPASGTGGIPWNAKRAFAVVTPLAAFVGKAGTARRTSATATAPSSIPAPGFRHIKHVYAIAAIAKKTAQASRKAPYDGRHVGGERSASDAA